MTKLCEFCGAYSPRNCELREEMNGICPWEESEPDPDRMDDPSIVPLAARWMLPSPLTAHGTPRHPLYVPSAQRLERFS